METANPYESPKSNTSIPSSSESYEPKLLSVHGRIGRLRYLAFSLVATLVGYLLITILAIAAGALLGELGGTIAILLFILFYIPIFIYTIIIAKRRLNDLDKSGWWQLLFIVPILNILLAIYMLLWPGTKGSNNYGPQPTKNSVLIVLAALIFPIALSGILLAIGIPAYQEYVEKAQQVLENQQ